MNGSSCTFSAWEELEKFEGANAQHDVSPSSTQEFHPASVGTDKGALTEDLREKAEPPQHPAEHAQGDLRPKKSQEHGGIGLSAGLPLVHPLGDGFFPVFDSDAVGINWLPMPSYPCDPPTSSGVSACSISDEEKLDLRKDMQARPAGQAAASADLPVGCHEYNILHPLPSEPVMSDGALVESTCDLDTEMRRWGPGVYWP